MRRRRGPNHHAERWMISWADFLTLLFALFVLLFAAARTDSARARRMADSVRRAMGGTQTASPAASSLESTLERELRSQIDADRMQVASDTRGVIITLRDEAFFASGADTLLPGAAGDLAKVAGILGNLPNPVLLEGHTDSTPIHNARFRSNWDLSSARSVAVLDLFVGHFGLDSGRFGIAGYADNRPVDANESAEGRAHNRRVDIVILNGPGKTLASVR
jgi:chemotaxis protein MotB